MKALEGNVLITGGTGTLGKAILQKAKDENWDCDITVFSTDPAKHIALKAVYPDVRFVLGDVCSPESVNLAVAGHDIVIHAAAMKHIVMGEENPMPFIMVNIYGTQNVMDACVAHRVKHFVAISTDKATAPVNAYGATKMLMERMIFQYAETFSWVNFHTVRYGNVFGSTGSFIHNWIRDVAELGYVRSTDVEMYRYWMTTNDAIDLILCALDEPSGTIIVPAFPKAASVGQVEEWLVPEGIEIKHEGRRPGERNVEMLLAKEETYRSQMVLGSDELPTHIRIYSSMKYVYGGVPMFSDDPYIQMTKEEFLEMAGFNADDNPLSG